MIEKLIEMTKGLEAQILQENLLRTEIKETSEYKSISEQIEQLSETQIEMLSEVPDSSVYLSETKQDIVAYFKEKQIEQYDNCFAKFKTKKSVNCEKLLTVIGGDIDAFVVISDISQKKLKTYAKDNKDIKRELLGCIQEDSREMVDVTIKYS